jgi:flagellar biogenesis protein FliO
MVKSPKPNPFSKAQLMFMLTLTLAMIIAFVAVLCCVVSHLVWSAANTDSAFQSLVMERIGSIHYLQVDESSAQYTASNLQYKTRNNYQAYKTLANIELANLEYVTKFETDELNSEKSTMQSFYQRILVECADNKYVNLLSTVYNENQMPIHKLDPLEVMDDFASEAYTKGFFYSLAFSGILVIISLVLCVKYFMRSINAQVEE